LRMNVVFAADRDRVAQGLGCLVEGSGDNACGVGERKRRVGVLDEMLEHESRCFPSAKVLRRERLAGHLAEVAIDVGRFDAMQLAVSVAVLKKVLARKVLALANDARDAAVVKVELAEFAALALEAEMKYRAA